MNLSLLIIIVVAGLLLSGLVLLMLNRAWGNFPGPRSSLGIELPNSQAKRVQPLMPTEKDAREFEQESPPPMPEGNLIPVLHPMVRRAVEQSLERGGSPYAIYFVRDGEFLYLNLDRIADPMQRATMARTFQALNAGDSSGVSLGEMIRAIGQIGRN